MGLMPSMSPNVFRRRRRWLRCGKYVVITHTRLIRDVLMMSMIIAAADRCRGAADTKKSANDESTAEYRIIWKGLKHKSLLKLPYVSLRIGRGSIFFF